MHIVETEPFGNTFGPKAQRKRPRLDIGSIEELGESSTAAQAAKDFEDVDAVDEDGAYHPTTSLMREPVYAKGTSRRIWGELYKVLDSSDVVIHVLDARDPLGTRCKPVVEYLRKEKAHKHLVYVLNKVDLVPTWVTVSHSPVLSTSTCTPHIPNIPSPFPSSHTPVKFLRGPCGIPTRWDCYESGRTSVFPRFVPHLCPASCGFCSGHKVVCRFGRRRGVRGITVVGLIELGSGCFIAHY